MFDRMHVTRASRVMLPFYILFSLALGLTWLLQADSRTNTSLAALENVWPLRGTGVVLLVLALALAAALITKNRALCGLALLAGSVAYSALAAVFCLPLELDLVWGWPFLEVGNPAASLSAPYWPVIMVVAQFASAISVIFEEQGTYASVTSDR